MDTSAHCIMSIGHLKIGVVAVQDLNHKINENRKHRAERLLAAGVGMCATMVVGLIPGPCCLYRLSLTARW